MKREKTRKLVKTAQHMMNGGDYLKAAFLLNDAKRQTRENGKPTESAYFDPRIRHRIGLVVAHFQGPDVASKYFCVADELFDPNNAVGRAINLRDHGWALWQEGETDKGIQMLEQALDLLKPCDINDERYGIERLVTEGMLARTSAYSPLVALEVHKEVDIVVCTGNKLVYTRDNLNAMLPQLSGSDYWKAFVRFNQLNARILVMNEIDMTKDDLFNGRFISAASGTSLRTMQRLFPSS